MTRASWCMLVTRSRVKCLDLPEAYGHRMFPVPAAHRIYSEYTILCEHTHPEKGMALEEVLAPNHPHLKLEYEDTSRTKRHDCEHFGGGQTCS